MKALLVIAMLNDFVYGKNILIKTKGREKLVNNIKLAIENVREKGVKIIYIKCYHKKSDPCIMMGGVHCLQGTKSADIIEELKPEESDIVVPKISYDGFYKTILEKVLRNLKVKNVYIVGAQTDCCVLATALSAAYRDFDVTVIEDCCSTKTDQRHKVSIDFMKDSVCKVSKLNNVKW